MTDPVEPQFDPSNNTTPLVVPDGDFVQLFMRHQRRLFLHILAQVPQPVDAEEILQDVNVIAWSKFEQFKSGTNFLAWVSKIAAFEVLKYRSKKRRQRLQFSEEFLDVIAQESLQQAEQLDERRTALAECIEHLRARDRELIRQRYAAGESGKDLAENIGRPANSVYQSLGRIRRTLLECIQRRMATAS
ncbi:MAG: sigma-70 family RNA polymerase sigma factor [Planctomycetaceae bacterium]|nr:sigma-70 family RNA polymerase sigma factor [Planctomycetaceae bacterium]